MASSRSKSNLRWPRRGHIVTDERGDAREISDWIVTDSSVDPFRREAARRIEQIVHDSSNTRVSGVLVGVALGLYLGLNLMFRSTVGPGGGWVIAVLIFIPLSLVSAAIAARSLRARSDEIARVVRELGVCAGCGYDLHGIPDDEEWRRACPECGAAWIASAADSRPPLESEPVRSSVEEYANTWRRNWGLFLRRVLDKRTSGRIKDDRGRKVPILGPDYEAEFDVAAGGRDRGHTERVRRAIRPVGRFTRIFVAIVTALPFLVIALGMLRTAPFGGPGLPMSGTIGALMGAGMFAACPFLVLRGNFAYSPRIIRDRLLGVGLCPSCAEPIALREPDEDGRVACPSCSASWRSDRISIDAPRLQCRQCGYDLEGLPIAQDGCRECPECGAAWRAGQDSP